MKGLKILGKGLFLLFITIPLLILAIGKAFFVITFDKILYFTTYILGPEYYKYRVYKNRNKPSTTNKH